MTTRRADIALVGTENSHAEHIIRHLNGSTDGHARVVALAGGPTDRNKSLAELGSIGTVVDTPEELLGTVDALIVTSRDGRLHREQATPFLAAGTPVWVDKPLACTVQDARAILDAAADGKTQVTSSSALRWLPEIETLVREAAARVGEIQTVTVTGPADETSEYGGIFFYGIHVADVAQRLAPGRTSPVRVGRAADTILAHYDAAGTAVTLEFVRPEPEAQVPFHVTVVGRHGVLARELRLGADYLRPGVDAFLSMLSSAALPVTEEAMLEPISVLEEVATSL